MSGRRFKILTFLLVLTIVFCVKGSVMSMGNTRRAQENYHYMALEQDYVRHAKEFLKEQGLDNCGVMMTRVTNEDGSREYTVRLHHRKLNRMSEQDKLFLENRLSEEEFEREACVFRYEL